MIRVDYHFHPNLPLFVPVFGKALARRRARKLWRKFAEHKLSLVLSSEHAYKNPKISYEILQSQRPKDAKTFLIPAVEALTAEGIDMIIFAKNPETLYKEKDICTPWALTEKELVKKVASRNDLYGIVVHPHTPGTTGIANILGEKEAKRVATEWGYMEMYNGAFETLIFLMEKLGLHKLVKEKYKAATRTRLTPKDLPPKGTRLTGGSDAHHPWEVGGHIAIEKPYKKDYGHLFKVATSSSGKIVMKKDVFVLGLAVNGVTVLREWLIKNLIKLLK